MKLPAWIERWRNVGAIRKGVEQNSVTPISTPYGFETMFGWMGEAFAGAWQQDLVLTREMQLAFSAVFACVSLRASDIAKLDICVRKAMPDGTYQEAENSPFSLLLDKPNRYQTLGQFVLEWISSKLIHGNTYVLKERDGRGMVSAMYILNPQNVRVLISEDGGIYYQLGTNRLVGQPYEGVTVPQSEIIHDRGLCLFHPLIGISPLYAAGAAATQGTNIQQNSKRFFANMSRPGGHLSAPGTIDDATAARLKKEFESSMSGANLGRLFVSGDGLKFEPFNVPAEQAQLIQQLDWTAADVARAFKVPGYKIGLGSPPSLGDIASLTQEYYQQALQPDIEMIEDLLEDGLNLPSNLDIEFDVDDLLRMDPKTRAEVMQIEISGGVRAPNEARARINLKPVKGGDSPYLQQQNYSLAALDKRDKLPNPFVIDRPATNPTPSSSGPPPAADPNAGSGGGGGGSSSASQQQNAADDLVVELKELIELESLEIEA